MGIFPTKMRKFYKKIKKCLYYSEKSSKFATDFELDLARIKNAGYKERMLIGLGQRSHSRG